MKIKRIILTFFLLDFLVIACFALMGEYIWILNSQIAIISSIAVTLGSYYGYKKNIDRRVKTHENFDDSYDEIDKMDDQFDLYSPDVPEIQVKVTNSGCEGNFPQKQEMTKEEIKEEIKKNKDTLKKNNVKNLYKSFGAMSSIYRLGGYIILVLGFFFLNNNGNLHILSYLGGFLIVPIIALTINFYSSRT